MTTPAITHERLDELERGVTSQPRDDSVVILRLVATARAALVLRRVLEDTADGLHGSLEPMKSAIRALVSTLGAP